MVNVAHGPETVPGPVAHDGEAVRTQGVAGWLGELFQDCPGLWVLTMDARYAERDLCQAIASRGRDYVVRVKGKQPAVLRALATGSDPGALGKPSWRPAEEGGGDPAAPAVDR